ncbi:hypothetical protein CF120_17500 [Aeromonas allosaccharophila]|nr:hypothetical protein CF120_17500 [Aeromonas allosaccharophila]
MPAVSRETPLLAQSRRSGRASFAAERIMQMAEREQAHRHSIQQEQLSQSRFLATSYIKQDTLGKKMGFGIAVLVLVFACLMGVLGHEILAGILAGLDLVG